MTAPEPDTGRQPAGLVKALALYTGLRLGVFGVCFLIAVAIVLPSTSGPKASRVLACALAAAVVSVPICLLVGRRLRSQLTAALLAGRERRMAQDREYDARVRAARAQRSTTTTPSGTPGPPDGA